MVGFAIYPMRPHLSSSLQPDEVRRFCSIWSCGSGSSGHLIGSATCHNGPRPPHSARREALLEEGLKSGRLVEPIGSPTRYAPARGRQTKTYSDVATLDYGSPPLILNRACPGAYSDQFGDVYVRVGLHGVTDTSAGEFSARH